MKPAPVDFRCAESAEEAVELLHQLGDEAKVLAGGQSLLPVMNLRMAAPACLVDINRLQEYDGIRQTEAGVAIGALTRHLAVERAEGLGERWNAFREAAPHVGHYPIRVRGTFGGSISHAEPTAEFPLIALTLGATMIALSKDGEREIAADSFFRGPMTSDLAPEELLTEVRLPAPPAGAVTAFEEFSERSGDFAVASACVGVSLAAGGECEWARVGLGAVGPTPVRSARAEEVLCGSVLTEEVIEEAARAAQEECEPSDSLHASSWFRRELVGVLVARSLRRATATATA
jgi:CO/xanthine dehydrogenase FAD-binding subunit